MTPDDPHDSGPGEMWSMEPWLRDLLYLAKRQMTDLERRAARMIITGKFRDGGHIGKFSDPIPYVIPRYEAIMPGKSAKLTIIDEAHIFKEPNIDAFDYPARDLLPVDKMSDMTKALFQVGDIIDLETDRRFKVIGVDHAYGPDMSVEVEYQDQPHLKRTVMRVSMSPKQSHPKRYRKGDK